ncbi:MAG: GTP-binding protein [Firmicutes bacterium]|nr:GTP-binding protein [Bacillota bacterium]
MTKVDIVSGFLGAGKTTFIKEMIAKVYKGQRVVLIENEFGEIGIDSGFMKNAGIEVTEMNSGCICCTLVGDFARSLKQVVEQFKPERVVIEPSGVGKLSDVAAAVADVSEEAGVEINSRIAVVDGKKAKMYMKNFGEFYNNQIESATTIVISRTQNMDEAKLKECIELIREKNSEASIITTPWERLEGAAIEGAISHGYDLEKELMEEYRHAHHHDHDHDHGDDCTCGCHDHDHHHHHHHADEVFDSWGVETVHVFTRSGLEDIMGLFSTTDDFGTVLRAKGIVETEDGSWVEFDMVPEEVEIRETSPDYIGRICVIGADLNKEELARVFDR